MASAQASPSAASQMFPWGPTQEASVQPVLSVFSPAPTAITVGQSDSIAIFRQSSAPTVDIPPILQASGYCCLQEAFPDYPPKLTECTIILHLVLTALLSFNNHHPAGLQKCHREQYYHGHGDSGVFALKMTYKLM